MPKKANFKIPEIAERWGCSQSHVLSLIYQGDLLAFDVSTNPKARSNYRVRADVLEAFEDRRTLPPVESPVAKSRHRVKVEAGDVIEFFS